MHNIDLKNVLENLKVQNMFRIKPINFIVMTTPKLPKTNNVLVNVGIVTTHSQQLEHVYNKRELVKTKGAKY